MMALERQKTESEGLQIGIKSDGTKYSIRDDRSRYFFPNEWISFYNALRPSNRFIYETLLQTGARITEILHLKPADIDFDRLTLTLRVTKRKAALKEKMGKRRTFVISPQFAKKIKRYIQEEKILGNEYVFHTAMNKTKPLSQETVLITMKNALKRTGIKDWYNFSLHNIRKTTGNWLKALGVPAEEICLRLGHDYNTYLKHYGSATIFDRTDRVEMIHIIGNMYGF